ALLARLGIGRLAAAAGRGVRHERSALLRTDAAAAADRYGRAGGAVAPVHRLRQVAAAAGGGIRRLRRRHRPRADVVLNMSARTLLRGGSVISPAGPVAADVAIEAGKVTQVGGIDARPGDDVVDAGGRFVLPGFIDVHSHVDGLLGDPEVSRSLLRQGVTTVIGGQDGVSYAPGDGADPTAYF